MQSRTAKALAAAVLASLSFACSDTSVPTNRAAAPGTTASTPASAPSPEAETAAIRPGKDLYTINCLTCHKSDGSGGKVTVEGKTLNADDLTSAKMKAKTDEKLYDYISDGIIDEGMPAFKDTLKPEEIRAVVAHLRDLQK